MMGRSWVVPWLLALAAGSVQAEERRIVSLAPAITETLFAVGAGDRVVGRTDYCDWPPEAATIPSVGSYVRPSVEVILARQPDLVLVVPTPGNRKPVETIEELGVEIVVVSEGPTVADVLDTIRTVGRKAGRAEEAGELAERMERRITEIRRRVEDVPSRRVLLVVDRNPLVVAGEGTLLDELLGIAGAENVAAGLGAWPRLSLEHLIRTQPDVIVDTSMNADGPSLDFYEGLALEAVRKGRIHAVRMDAILRPGPRLPEGLERLVRAIHPEIHW